MTVDGDVLLVRLESNVPLLAVDDFTGRFWGLVPDAVDAVWATGTPNFQQVIILSIKVEERRKTECS